MDFKKIFEQPQKEKKVVQQTDDRPQWQKDQQELKNVQYKIIDKWTENIQQNPEKAVSYFAKQSDILNFSPSNVMLVLSQRPDATLLKDYNTWKNMGYSLQGKQVPINIIERGNSYVGNDGSMRTAYNPKRVYDVSQTTAAGKIATQIYPAKPFLAAIVRTATAEIVPTTADKCGEKQDALFSVAENKVYVNTNQDITVMCVSVLRELSHASFARENPTYDRESNQFAAECSANLIANKSGIQNIPIDGSKVVEFLKDYDLQGGREELGKIQSTAKFLHGRAERYIEMEKQAEAQQTKQKQQGAR